MLDCEMEKLEQVCREAGPGTLTSETWTQLVNIADAWSEYVEVRGKLNNLLR